MKRRELVGAALLGAAGLAAGGLPGSGAPAAAPDQRAKGALVDPSRLFDCLVTPIKDIPVPTQEAGMIKEMKVQEGQDVAKDELLAQIDDSQILMAKKVADKKLEAANAEAKNRVNVRYAEASQKVAKAEFDQAQDTNKRAERAVTVYELRRLQLKVNETDLHIEQASHELAIAGLTADVRGAEAEAAALDVQRRQIKAPVAGRVEKRFREEGEWVKPGDPVVKILQMDRLYVEGCVDARFLTPADVEDRPVIVTIRGPRGQETFEGQIRFVSYEILQGPKFQVKAVVENRKKNGHWILQPGMYGEMIEMIVQLRK